jgi:hypothetical protein
MEYSKYEVLQELQKNDDLCYSSWNYEFSTTNIKKNNSNFNSINNSNLTITSTRFNTKFLIYVAYHNDTAKNAIFKKIPSNDHIKPYYIDSTIFFEYISYRNFYPFHTAEWENLDYIGLTTYKTLNDATFCAIEIKRLLNIAKSHNYDIIPLIRSSKKLLIASIKSHTTNFKHA